MSFGSVNSAAGQNSAGTRLNRMLDNLGFPDKYGDLMGAALDARMGNVRGMRRNLFDAFNNVKTGELDFRGHVGLPSFGRVPSPFAMLGALQASPLLGAFAGPGALSLLASAGPMGVASGFLDRVLGGIGRGGGGPAGSAVGGSSGNRVGSETQSIFNDPSLSFEEKMAMLLMTLAEKQEKEIEAHMAKMDRSGKGSGGAGSVGGGIGGILQGALGGFMAGGPIGAVLGGVSSLFGGGGGGGAGTSAAGEGQKSEQRMAAELQMMQEKLSRLYSTLSNVMKSFHQTASNAIRNIN